MEMVIGALLLLAGIALGVLGMLFIAASRIED